MVPSAGGFFSYETLLNWVLQRGHDELNARTGERVRRSFGLVLRHDMSERFPLIASKRVFFRGVVEELAWFLRGSNDVTELQSKDIHIWDEHVLEDGTIGPGYGPMWRSWPRQDGSSVDQIERLVTQLKRDPTSRRHLVIAYNPGEADRCSLPPCHVMFQVVVMDGCLNLLWIQRSCDLFLGLPFNLASYGLLLSLLAKMTGLKPGILKGVFGDAHIYMDQHEEQVREQLVRVASSGMPELELSERVSEPNFDLKTLTYDDVRLVGYHPHGPLKGKIVK